MLLSPDSTEFDIFVGTRIGSFKHIKYHTEKNLNTKQCIENLQDIAGLQKGDGVTSMCWGSEEQTEIIIGRENRVVQCYDTVTGLFTHQLTVEDGEGAVVGACRVGRKLVTATANGAVKMWGKKPKEMAVGQIDKMKACPHEKGLIITGGKENDLKVWKIGSPEPVFSAKNVRNDWLELRQPVWATDVCFLPGGAHLVASCSRYGTVRLYDTRAQRRPVCDVPFPNMAATCIAPGLGERQVLVGFARGHLHNVDLRGKGRSDKGYKGSAGAVTCAETVPGAPYVVSVSLDRHLSVHHRDSKQLLYKQYLTSKLSAVLVQMATSTPLTKVKSELKTEAETAVVVEDMDQLFDKLETVSEVKAAGKKTSKAKRRAPVDSDVEMKSEDEAGCEDEQQSEGESTADDKIAKLLKLTEKKKKKMEKIKKKKKEKSVFHNA